MKLPEVIICSLVWVVGIHLATNDLLGLSVIGGGLIGAGVAMLGGSRK